MSTPVFNIMQNDLAPEERQNCRLIIEMNPNYFYYTVIDDNNSVIVLKYYQLAYNNNQEMIQFLEEIVEQDVVLKKNISSCRIIFNWPESSLVPMQYFDNDRSDDMLNMIHGNLNKGLTLSEKIDNVDIYIIYRIPPVLDDFLKRNFPACTYRHYHSGWHNSMLKDERLNMDYVNLVFNTSELTAAVVIGKKPQMIQSLRYETPEDVAWQVLNIYQRFHLNPQDMPLLVGGIIDQNSAMFEELLKYFAMVELDGLPGAIHVPEQFQSFPAHFFSPLLKLVLCVS